MAVVGATVASLLGNLDHAVGQPLAASSGTLSTDHAQAEMLAERIDQKSPTHRSYRYFCCQMADGRIFQAGSSKDLDFDRPRDSRPPWLDKYRA